MNNDLVYRLATVADVPALKALGIASYGQYKEQLAPESWETMYTLLQDGDNYANIINTGKGFVCTAGDELVGMAFLVYHGNPWLFYPAEWSYLRMIGVHPEYGGKGIGRQLTQMCVDEAIAAKQQTVALHTSELMHAGRHIYESLGFAVEQELPEKFGMRYWLYKMEL